MLPYSDVVKKPSFKFEEFWLHLPDFHQTVSAPWNKPLMATNTVRRIHIKLCRMVKALKKWQRELMGVLRN